MPEIPKTRVQSLLITLTVFMPRGVALPMPLLRKQLRAAVECTPSEFGAMLDAALSSGMVVQHGAKSLMRVATFPNLFPQASASAEPGPPSVSRSQRLMGAIAKAVPTGTVVNRVWLKDHLMQTEHLPLEEAQATIKEALARDILRKLPHRQLKGGSPPSVVCEAPRQPKPLTFLGLAAEVYQPIVDQLEQVAPIGLTIARVYIQQSLLEDCKASGDLVKKAITLAVRAEMLIATGRGANSSLERVSGPFNVAQYLQEWRASSKKSQAP